MFLKYCACPYFRIQNNNKNNKKNSTSIQSRLVYSTPGGCCLFKYISYFMIALETKWLAVTDWAGDHHRHVSQVEEEGGRWREGSWVGRKVM